METKAREAVYTALDIVKGVPSTASPQASLIRDLGLESIDIVDLFFEIEQATGIVVELNQVRSVRRFEDISIQNLIDYLSTQMPGD